MFGPTKREADLMINTLLVLALLVLALVFWAGRCSAKYTVSVKATEQGAVK